MAMASNTRKTIKEGVREEMFTVFQLEDCFLLMTAKRNKRF
jgi:hypothetical protein